MALHSSSIAMGDYENEPSLPNSVIEGITEWASNAKIQTQRGQDDSRELYIKFLEPKVEGWVPFMKLPAGYRRCAAASAKRQDAVRRREAGLPELGPTRRKRRRDERRDSGAEVPDLDGDGGGGAAAADGGGGHGRRIKRKRTISGDTPTAWPEYCQDCLSNPNKAVLTAEEDTLVNDAYDKCRSGAALDICDVCALGATRRKEVLLYPGFRDCDCLPNVGCKGCFAEKMKRGLEFMEATQRMASSTALEGQKMCGCGRVLFHPKVWCCEACGGIGVHPGPNPFGRI